MSLKICPSNQRYGSVWEKWFGNVAVRRPMRWSRDEERALIECFETSMHRNVYRAFQDFELIERLFNVKCPMKNLGKGFTFDVDTNQVVGIDEQWIAVQVRNQEFPHFPKLDEIMNYKREQEAARNDREQEAAAMEAEIMIEFG
ncbi:Serine protease inhibitor (SERPIN) family protein [Corchorus olitorius]|uniref:Serine protease inhibitor (SERPIN) family protein n=1 Tax=Corchorus olitorius TaxID=93759 RepID=A0A1R3KW58_9ROSI|nr:Serine protease inhibitor (SERPIN) family protein [Corchorus olitorius]